MKKTVAFKTPAKAPDPADAWVAERREAPETSLAPEDGPNLPRKMTAEAEATLDKEIEAMFPDDPMKRFTIDVPLSLHTRVKVGCARQGLKMADVLREMLEKKFPA